MGAGFGAAFGSAGLAAIFFGVDFGDALGAALAGRLATLRATSFDLAAGFFALAGFVFSLTTFASFFPVATRGLDLAFGLRALLVFRFMAALA